MVMLAGYLDWTFVWTSTGAGDKSWKTGHSSRTFYFFFCFFSLPARCLTRLDKSLIKGLERIKKTGFHHLHLKHSSLFMRTRSLSHQSWS